MAKQQDPALCRRLARLDLARAYLDATRAAGGDMRRCHNPGCSDFVHVCGPVAVANWDLVREVAYEMLLWLESEIGPRN